MDRWIAKLGAGDGIRTFAKDGIIDPEKWFARTDNQEKILFLLKESYEQDDTKEGDDKYPKRISDIVKWLRHEQCTNLCGKREKNTDACKTCPITGTTYNALALLTYGIDKYCEQNERYAFNEKNEKGKRYGADIEFREKEKKENLLKSIAIMNVKKADGKNPSDLADLYAHAMYDQKFIREQIAIIKPTLIICCGTYDILQRIYINETDIDCFPNAKLTIGKLNDINIIGTRHPNRASYKDLYDNVMASYKELKHIHA